ncbi:DUF4402 domain-containing protein [Deferribacter desulfuricans]|uniref:DUF4402 domain-containing protein n=1 Tax=Deferribacter desulfuricans TaxID=197162 RepID=UPI0003012F92|nr:DUF4402 domain-containing protein [Deferribacter desulfuricans]
MKKFAKVLTLAMVMSVLATAAFAASATGTATLDVIQALTITKNQDLNLGQVVQGDATGATVATTDANAASFTVTGQANAALSVTVDSSVTLDDGSGNTINVSLTNDATSPALDATGSYTFHVGGSTGPIASSQPVGTYTGTFNVTVDYQ